MDKLLICLHVNAIFCRVAEQETYSHLNTPSDKVASQKSCQEGGGDLVFPLNARGSRDLYAYMVRNDITTAWLGEEIRPTHWYNVQDQVPLYNQGCYRFPRDDFRIMSTAQECVHYCSDENATFTALQASSQVLSTMCSCIDDTSGLDRLGDGDCNATCDVFNNIGCGSPLKAAYRIIATNNRDSFKWSGPNAHNAHCASGKFATLKRLDCRNKSRAHCEVGDSPVYIDAPSTWFEVFENCRELGGVIQTGNLSGGLGWYNIISWRLSGNTSLTYTNWAAGQPDFGAGACIVITRDGTWITDDCGKTHVAICKHEHSGESVHDANETSIHELFWSSDPFSQTDQVTATAAAPSSVVAVKDSGTNNSLLKAVVSFGVTLVGLVMAGQVVLVLLNRYARSRVTASVTSPDDTDRGKDEGRSRAPSAESILHLTVNEAYRLDNYANSGGYESIEVHDSSPAETSSSSASGDGDYHEIDENEEERAENQGNSEEIYSNNSNVDEAQATNPDYLEMI